MSEKDDEVKRLLLKAEMDLELGAEFEKAHKAAFRIAFDFLHACFPPTRKTEYWMSTVQLMAKRVNEHKQNVLVRTLLLGVYDYLGEIAKDLPAENEEGTQNEN